MLQYPAIKTANKKSNTLKDILGCIPHSIDCHYDTLLGINENYNYKTNGKSEDF